MKVDIRMPNMVQYSIVFEPEDVFYSRCMWALINLDHDAHTMTVTSDCGNYAHEWLKHDGESFLEQLTKVTREYLLEKVSAQSWFDFEASKAELLRKAREWGLFEYTLTSLSGIENCGEEAFVREVSCIANLHFEDIPVVKRYPADAQTFADVFQLCLMPLLVASMPEPNEE